MHNILVMITITLITFLVAMPLFSYVITPIIFNRITSIILMYSAILSLNVLDISSLASGVDIYSGLFHVTSTSLNIEVFIFIFVGNILIVFKPWRKVKAKKENPLFYITKFAFPVVIIVVAQAFSILISTSDIVIVSLSIELLSFSAYVLCRLYRKRKSDKNPELKNFVLGGLSTLVILLGSSVIYYYTGLTGFKDFYRVFINSNQYIQKVITIGLVLIIISFLFKIESIWNIKPKPNILFSNFYFIMGNSFFSFIMIKIIFIFF